MRNRLSALGLVLALIAAATVSAGWASGSARRDRPGTDRLELYTVTGSPEKMTKLLDEGYDAISESSVGGKPAMDLVLSRSQASTLESKGFRVKVWRNEDGRTAQQLAAVQGAGGYRVWRSWDQKGGIEDEIHRIAKNHPDYVKLVRLGETYNGRGLIALKVTKNARSVPDGRRPATVFASTQHAREWISTEVNRRLLNHVVDASEHAGKMRDLLAKRELWFYLVANPDGYEYTFDADRLWRKNLRNNNGIPGVQVDDGVDPNRNFPTKWNYDDEGSETNSSSETYRGPGPASEPETKAMMALLDRSGGEFLVNFHSFGNLLLYSFGWQVQTASTDDPIFKALSGTDERPAVRGRDEIQRIAVKRATGGTFTLTFESDAATTDDTTGPIPYNATAEDVAAALEALPDAQDVWEVEHLNVTVTGGALSTRAIEVRFKGLRVREDVEELVADAAELEGEDAGVTIRTTRHGLPDVDPGVAADLYTTNGDTNDYAHNHGTLAWVPELDDGEGNNTFIFPDDNKQVEAEFRRYLPFAKDVIRSAGHPARPSSHQGNETKAMYIEPFAESWGDPQTVEVRALRTLGPIKLKYRINGGSVTTAPTSEWDGGERYGDAGDLYYRMMRGKVRGTNPGDHVSVWFEGGGAKSRAFTYLARKESGNRVLIFASEDYTGGSNFPPYDSTTNLNYVDYYKAALAENGFTADVYDLDATSDDPDLRVAPDAMGVLSHYDAVINYTGNDNITRHPDGLGGTMAAVANQSMLELRDYLNEGGRLLYTGSRAGRQYETTTLQEWSPTGNDLICDGNQFTDDDPTGYSDCIPVTNDFHQYYLGAHIYNTDGGLADFDTGDLSPVRAIDQPFSGMTGWTLDQGNSADNQYDAEITGLGPGSMLTTSSILKPDTYPQFESWSPAEYVTGTASRFEPHSGNHYLYSNRADLSFKRIRKTLDLSAMTETDTPKLHFWYSADTEIDWDMLFVEAHPSDAPRGQEWTTLPDENGTTTQDTGLSCADPDGDGSSWTRAPYEGGVHPFLQHYQTFHADSQTCDPTGTTGEWNAFSGNSAGWQEFVVDLSDYSGESVDVSISYASDWAFQGFGVWLDDISLENGAATIEETGFEDDMGGWKVGGPPVGSDPNANNFVRTSSVGFQIGAATATDDTLYLGFGLEGVDTAAKRANIMERAMNYLLR